MIRLTWTSCNLYGLLVGDVDRCLVFHRLVFPNQRPCKSLGSGQSVSHDLLRFWRTQHNTANTPRISDTKYIIKIFSLCVICMILVHCYQFIYCLLRNKSRKLAKKHLVSILARKCCQQWHFDDVINETLLKINNSMN